MSDTRFCVECKWCEVHVSGKVSMAYTCNHEMTFETCPVTGYRRHPLRDCFENRKTLGFCAPEGRHFEPKDEPEWVTKGFVDSMLSTVSEYKPHPSDCGCPSCELGRKYTASNFSFTKEDA